MEDVKNIKNSYEMVKEFHETFGHPVRESGGELGSEAVPDDLLKLRINLIAEEFFELVGAAYSQNARKFMENQWDNMYSDHTDVNGDGSYDRDIIEVADALADLEYVINGAALVFGIKLPKIVKEVHDSNMSKLGEDGKPIYRGDGKILKGPDYFTPDIKKVLDEN